jgi:hypothetical protein
MSPLTEQKRCTPERLRFQHEDDDISAQCVCVCSAKFTLSVPLIRTVTFQRQSPSGERMISPRVTGIAFFDGCGRMLVCDRHERQERTRVDPLTGRSQPLKVVAVGID